MRSRHLQAQGSSGTNRLGTLTPPFEGLLGHVKTIAHRRDDPGRGATKSHPEGFLPGPVAGDPLPQATFRRAWPNSETPRSMRPPPSPHSFLV